MIFFIIITTFALTNSCENPEKILNEARNKIKSNSYLAYNQQALYPNPVGIIDTLFASIVFSKNINNNDRFDFKFTSKISDVIYFDGNLKSVNHKRRKIRFFSNPNKTKEFISNNRNYKFSPIQLLEKEWKFVSDTVINKNKISNFYLIETDTIINGNSIVTEFHIFIDNSSKLIKRFERRNFFKGDLSQTVIFNYSNYILNRKEKKIDYKLPLNYVSVPFEESVAKNHLEVGEKAILFNALDINGDLIELEKYDDKKILLVFSAVNCGYSQLALEHIINPNFNLKENISVIYIQPLDNKTSLTNYINKFPIPFPIIPSAIEIAESYGVSVYPTFFLLNEERIIEKVEIGYNKKFINNLEK